MRKIKYLFFCVFLINGIQSHSQSIDTSAINLLGKLEVFRELQYKGHIQENVNKEFLDKYLNSAIEINYLKSNINRVIVIEVIVPSFTESDINPINDCKRFVIAITKTRNQIYRLVNFRINDVKEFIKDLIHEKTKYSLFPNSISKDYFIEGVEFKCLIKGSRKRYINTKKFSCYHYCGEQIRIY